jgi:hypothetical protein
MILCAAVPAAAQQHRVFYDHLENGRLAGGKIVVDLSDPAQRLEFGADLPTDFRMLGWPVTTIHNNGPTANRVDVVILGDGYTAPEMTDYSSHTASVVTQFFNEEPFAAYASYFNVHRVDVESAESGVDEINLNIYRDTALDMAYGCFNIDRLLCIDVAKAYAAADSAPDVDQIMALANSTRYGGAGYPDDDLGTLAGDNFSAVEIALHEFGHSFADLHDEYDYADGASYFGAEFLEPNVTKFTATILNQQQRKWFRWLPLPTVDAFQGGAYYQFGVYRPTVNSKMRALNRPFEEVNVEQIVMSIYRTVSPADDASPTSTQPLSACTALFVDPLQPLDHNLTIQWSVNGNAVPGATGTNFVPVNTVLVPGLNTVSVSVVDPTSRVRDEAFRATRMTFTRSWQVLSLGVTGECSCVAAASATAEPAPLAKNRYISFVPGNVAGAIRVTAVELMNPEPPNAVQPPPDFSSLVGQSWWVGPPAQVTEYSGAGDPFFAAKLQCEPYHHNWSTIPRLHVTGEQIAPSSRYAIQVMDAGCDEQAEGSFSPTLEVQTARWGDAAEPFQNPQEPLNQPNALDIGDVVDKVKAVLGASARVVTQLQPADIDVMDAVSALDLARVVDAVKGFAYPYQSPPPCP